MTVFKDSRNNKWRAQIYDPWQKRMRHVPGGPWETRRDALKAEQAALDARGATDPRTVEQFAANWPESHPKRTRTKESTATRHREKVRRFVAEHGRLRLDAVSTPLAHEFCLRHPSDLPSLRAMFEDARREGRIQGNPFSRLGIDRSKGRAMLPSEWLLEDDVKRLIQCARDAHPPNAHTLEGSLGYGSIMAAIVTFAAYTGVRPGELMGLEWRDLYRDTVEIRQARCSVTGSLTLPKNNRTREIVYPKAARDAVESMPRLKDQRFVFVTPTGRPLRHGALRYHWHPVRCLFGRPQMDFYELRHFCATYLWERLPEADVALQLGHTDGGELVRTVYGHRSERAARARILQAFDGYNEGDIASLDERRRAG